MSEVLQPAVVIFLLTYLAVALGEIPGLALDRTGIALLGAIAMVAFGMLTTEEAARAVDFKTILLLFGLMVLSTQFRLGGFYTRTAFRLTQWMDRPRYFLFALMLASAALSALLANDIVCLASTPVLTVSLIRRSMNPVPFLLGLAISSNIGSAATIIGNPQNMLIGQTGQLHFGSFLLWCVPPSLAALFSAYALMIVFFRGRWSAVTSIPSQASTEWPVYDAHQTRKAWLITAALVTLFFTHIPREITALVAAAILLCSRHLTTRALLGWVDWHLIALFCGLFVVIRGLEITGIPDELVAWATGHGVSLINLYMLTGISVLLSNLVSNVPATMLLIKFLPPSPVEPWYVLALSSTFAGNLITIGSIANLIVIEQARLQGVRISFRDHARVGVPVTLLSLLLLLAWIALVG